VAGFVPPIVEEAPAVVKEKAPIIEQAYEDVAFTGIRRAISKSMTASLRDIPQLTHNFSFDASAMLKYRETLKTGAEKLGLPNITLNDMILFAVSRLLKKHPDLNAHMPDANTLRRFSSVNLGMAVDTPRGLLVPVIKNADTLSLSEIAVEAKRLAKAAQDGTLTPDEMSGGTFTISNLGSFGVESFTPVINPPQTGILGVNNIVQRVKEQNGNISVYPAMGVSLTYDHRAVDGAPASRFGQDLCSMLTQFPLLLAL
jgi:pyruvate dehydrogenase E2 component (dihydrolipoamide acetyltransferase)